MLNLNQLRAFYHAAKNLNFSRAARELSITQPAVTSQVKFLEENLDLKLFRKKGGKIHLTEEGRDIYEYARRLFEFESEIEIAVEEIKKLKRGTLKIGTARTYARHFVPFLISRFHEAHPRIKIHLDEGNSREMIRSLINLKNELVIVSRQEEDPGVQYDLFSHEEVVLILPPDHPLAGKEGVGLKDLCGDPVIMKEKGSGTRSLVDGLFQKTGCTPRVLMETSDAETLKLLVQHGEGYSFLIREAAAAEIRDGRLSVVPIEDGKMFLDVSVGYLRDQPLSPPAEAFLESLRQLETREMRFKGLGVLMEEMLSSKEKDPDRA